LKLLCERLRSRFLVFSPGLCEKLEPADSVSQETFDNLLCAIALRCRARSPSASQRLRVRIPAFTSQVGLQLLTLVREIAFKPLPLLGEIPLELFRSSARSRSNSSLSRLASSLTSRSWPRSDRASGEDRAHAWLGSDRCRRTLGWRRRCTLARSSSPRTCYPRFGLSSEPHN